MRSRYWIAAALVLFILTNTPAFGLDWEAARTLAENNNNQLAGAKQQLESYKYSYNKAFTPLFPQLSASISAANSNSGTNSYAYGLSASQVLFDGLQNSFSIRSAFNDIEYQQASLNSVKATVLYDTRAGFIEVHNGQQNIKLLEKILAQRKDDSQMMELRYNSGKEDKGNLMRTQADEALAGYDLSSAKRDLLLARLKLGQLINETVAAVEENNAMPVPPTANLDELVETTPTYIMAKKQITSATLAKEATITGFLPTVSLSGNLRKSDTTWPPAADSRSLSMSLSYSFFPGGSNIVNVDIYRARLAQAEQDFAKATKDLRYNIELAYQNYYNAVESLAVGKINLAAAEERSKITKMKYLNGLVMYDEWNRIENSYIQAQKSYLAQEKAVLIAEAAWYKAYGGYKK